MESFATAYPVIFHDGEEEHDKGHIGLHSVLSFKKFQAQMSRIVGLPPTQLSTVFVCRRTLKDTTDKRQKLPINETTNFNIILNQHNPSRERDCHFLVSIKKSKKDRKGTRKRNAEADNCDDEDSVSSRGDMSPLEQRPKQQQHQQEQQEKDKTEAEFPEANSPTSILQRPLSPAISSPGDDVGVVGMLSQQQQQQRKPGASVDRVVLWRGEAGTDVAQPHRVEGFSVAVRSGSGHEARSWGSDTTRLPVARVVASGSGSGSLAQQARQQQQQQQLPRSGIYQPSPGSQRFAEAPGRSPATVAAGTSWLSMLARSQQQQQQQQQVTRSPLPVQQQTDVLSSCCKQCVAGGKSSFHFCVLDPVFEGFKGRRPPGGPVERPRPSVLA